MLSLRSTLHLRRSMSPIEYMFDRFTLEHQLKLDGGMRHLNQIDNREETRVLQHG